jgi:PAS domain-containing protein
LDHPESYLLQRRSEGTKKQQIIHFSIGTAIFAGGSLILAVLIQIFGGFGLDPGLGAFFSFPWAVLTFYAIMRYSLFDIRIIVSRTIGIVFLWTGFILLQLTAYHLLAKSIGDDLAIAITLTLVAFLLYGLPLNRWTQAWAQRIIVKDKYQYQNILNDSIKAILTILDQKKLVAFIIESIRKSMGARAVYLYWLHPSGRYDRIQGYGPLIDSGEEASFPLEMSRFIEKTGQTVMRDDPARITQEENEIRLAAYMLKIGVDLMVPLSMRERSKVSLPSARGFPRTVPTERSQPPGDPCRTYRDGMENANLYEEAKQARSRLRKRGEVPRPGKHPSSGHLHPSRGKFLYANPAVDRVTGYSLEEILNMDFWA